MIKFIGKRFTVVWNFHRQSYSVFDENGKYFGITKYRFGDVKAYLGRDYVQVNS